MNFIQAHELSAWVVGICGALFNIFLLYIIRTKSPKELHAYTPMLKINAIVDIMFSTTTLVAQPVSTCNHYVSLKPCQWNPLPKPQKRISCQADTVFDVVLLNLQYVTVISGRLVSMVTGPGQYLGWHICWMLCGLYNALYLVAASALPLTFIVFCSWFILSAW